ncbi:AMP-dependent synthetase [Sinomonas atrocyanea]|uniref:AMP-dependent synthetase n=1 Tax=Sinomonas atrocyanea TaxID=37927 RepID=A0A127A386_9MICC|nr:AMP-binding protein [Sinomonas atrocyanea]AMM33899.1 AMP-dependent synthetase [Sinomonas atrocyanea]GEB63480.1 O-succinylbenzoic acid--CoA ligase [Sinomonas atrocyanea]GGG56554.1 O-succinylbenzoic acid--CoA ligase [Sinomonas atrocyanea]
MNLDPVLSALAAALAGEGPAVEFGPGGSGQAARADGSALPEGTAVVVRTSGSTGQPKATALTVDALAASSAATAMRLRGEGQWLLALPLDYVAGVQVLVRSLFAGTRPWAMDLTAGFTPEAFADAAEALTDPIRLTSLVPTQLRRLLDDGSPRVLAALNRFNAVLLGGAAMPPDLLERAREAGVHVVTTYGSAETCGGCVYDGVPLDGVEVELVDGRVWLGGEVVAAGYVGDPERTAEHFRTDGDGRRWYLSSDVGEFGPDGRLRILGRADDVVITGGVKASAARVAAAVEGLPGVREAFVAGVDDPEWGQALVAAVVLAVPEDRNGPEDREEPGEGTVPEDVRAAAAERLGRLAPKSWLALEALPLLPNGKPDRRALTELLAARHRRR